MMPPTLVAGSGIEIMKWLSGLSLNLINYITITTVSSLGWVTPGAATEGVTPLFFPEKAGDLFFCLLSLSLSLFIAFTRVLPRHYSL